MSILTTVIVMLQESTFSISQVQLTPGEYELGYPGDTICNSRDSGNL